MKTILLTGGNGLIGQQLTRQLINLGYRVNWLSRLSRSTLPHKVYYWDIDSEKVDDQAIRSADIIVHMAGASIAEKIWTQRRRKELYDSRVKSAHLLLRTCMDIDRYPEKFITASAVGYYGHQPGVVLTEKNSPGDGFLSKLCMRWEDAADGFMCHGVSVAKIRIGIVLSNKGGSLPLFKVMSKFPVLPLPGVGQQHIPWVHVDDVVRIFMEAITQSHLSGAINAVSPGIVSMKEFLKTLAHTYRRHIITIPTPAFPLRILAGDMSELFLADANVAPAKLIKHGFIFEHTQLQSAFSSLL